MRDRSAVPGPVAAVVLAVCAALVVLPLLLAVFAALKSPTDFASTSPLAPPTAPTLANGVRLLTTTDFGGSLVITAACAGVLVLTQLPSSALAAYAFAWGRFRGRRILFRATVASLLVPPVLLVVPLYLLMAGTGLVGSFAALVVPFCLGSPFAVLLLRQRFREVPGELVDAARIDGASEWRVLVAVVAPICRPTIAALAIVTVVGEWNAYAWPLAVSGPGMMPVTVAAATLQSEHGTDWTLLMTAACAAILPLLVVFVVGHRVIARGLAVGEIA